MEHLKRGNYVALLGCQKNAAVFVIRADPAVMRCHRGHLHAQATAFNAALGPISHSNALRFHSHAMATPSTAAAVRLRLRTDRYGRCRNHPYQSSGRNVTACPLYVAASLPKVV